VQILRTERLVIRAIEPGDEQTIAAYRNDPEVARFQGWPLPFTSQDFAELVNPDRTAKSGWVSRCICDGSGPIGDIGLRIDDQQAELGISLARHAQGRGYASEALAAVSSEAFDQLGMHRLYAGVDPSNEAVIRLLKKAGWRYEGTAVKAYLHRGEWADDSTYALLAEEWHARL
jgi:RimJ/RimL family protein N-acetyltransferase